MTGLNSLREEFPQLRRCGRALTGEQRLADICVIQVMDALLAQPEAVRDLTRVDLYRRYFEMLEAAARVEGPASFAERYSPLHRQAHWLRVVEDFTEDEVADILRQSPEQVRDQLRLYEGAVGRQTRADVMIIEDEALIAHDLKRIAASMGHKVTGVARTQSGAISKFLKQRPHLILSDVQLADGTSGIDAVDTIHHVAEVPVVFITAFPERLLTGARGEPAFLISKPFEPNVVAATVSQALFLADSLPAKRRQYVPESVLAEIR